MERVRRAVIAAYQGRDLIINLRSPECTRTSWTRTMALRDWLPALALATLSTLMLPLLSPRPGDQAVAAGVFPPWWASGAILAAAGEAGSIVRLGAVPFIVVVRSESGDASQRLAAAGSLFSLDPNGITGCFTR